MKTKVEIFPSGWIGLSLSLKAEEIDVLISRLQYLKSKSDGHFHFHGADHSGTPGIADIEISFSPPEEADDMKIG